MFSKGPQNPLWKLVQLAKGAREVGWVISPPDFDLVTAPIADVHCRHQHSGLLYHAYATVPGVDSTYVFSYAIECEQ